MTTNFLVDKCTLRVYDKGVLDNCQPFDCGNEDLNDFFSKDLLNYTSELLGKSYCFTLDVDESKVVAAFTVSNDSIKTFILPNSRKKKVNTDIPRTKQMRSYPAVMIGRLGVSVEFRNIAGEEKSIGDQLMDFIKAWFVSKSNKTGCRFVVVDSYNTPNAIRYYERNGFLKLFSSEDQEKETFGVPKESELKTRLLYFDLIVLSE